MSRDDAARLGVVALGDSITVGEGSMTLGVTALSWAQWLARALDLPYTCYAFNGARTEDVLREQLPRVRADYDVGALYAGVNDVRGPDWDAVAYERDLGEVVGSLSARCDRLLVLTLPLDLGRPPSAPGPAEANAAVRRVAAAHGATVVDLEDFGSWTTVLPDAVHPTPLGQIEIADRAARALNVALTPSALAPSYSASRVRYAPRHARALARDLARRAIERRARSRRHPHRRMARLATRLCLARSPRVRAGEGVVLGRGVRFDVAPAAEIVLGDGCWIGERARVLARGGRVLVGPGAAIGKRVTIVAHAGVTIGAGAVIDDGAVIVDFNHVFDDVEQPIRLQPLRSAPVTVGAGARIGLGASILAGMSVGDRATVGPHAVVTADVPAGLAVEGVPARPGQSISRPGTKKRSNPSADSS